MKTVLVKSDLSYGGPDNWHDDEATKKIVALRRWCYKNVAKQWRTFCLDGVHDPYQDNPRNGYVAFQFECPKEAMKFSLYKTQ